jgi:cobalt/nickel transport system permease protein
MANVGDRFRDLGTLDALGARDTVLHRLDPRAKVLAVGAFSLAVASFGRYEVSALLPFTLFPVILAVMGEIPLGYLLRRILLALPFVLLLGALNPALDRAPVLGLGPIVITGGWLSYASMVIRLVLTVSAAVTLVAITGMDGVCQALERLGVPRVFTLQIGFLHRYTFVLAEEATRMLRARELRSHGRVLAMREFGPLAGHLLLRTWDRARRIHLAMLARGFEGATHTRTASKFKGKDLLFLAGWCAGFLLLRLVNVPVMLGRLMGGGKP